SGTLYTVLVILIMLIAGCFIDAMPMMLIGVPIFHPIAVSLGVDPLWFALLIVLSINVGALTPPVGLCLFVLKGINKEIPMHTIYTGAIPFVGGTLLSMVIIFFVPSIVSWLPNALK
ncbi:MAG: TRAP transporter large permease subunit, partial [Dehalococcoidales bacterium]|nr:TRAP transporter large permease subunit [Dehalococcoidales bacterium]